jgi:hypothetical protein
MARIKRIEADLFQFLSAMIRLIRAIRVLLARTSIFEKRPGAALLELWRL